MENKIKVIAFIDPYGYMSVVDVSTPKKARAYINKCLLRIKEHAFLVIQEHQNKLDFLGYTEEEIPKLPESLRGKAEYPFRISKRVIEEQQKDLEEIKEVEKAIFDRNDVNEIFQYLIDENPFSDYFIMNHKGQFISEVEDPEDEGFRPLIPNFSV